ncbi:radical SAM protein [Infirmifilum lucidum]|uniref:Radical SAM protein n=1 Tax=Infirmifilum lucidum TaxID=2776706 RepID=A0A7L9FI73_9CREN|nr:radical SAM protein [Infirmifilum lucidum]QOJ78723.1 radical SAM protein [Infirmifilum lucidum]
MPAGTGYNPLLLGEAVRRMVSRGVERKYYRFRGGRWYGGISTADCVGCNLRCVFCWSREPREKPWLGKWRFYAPEEVYGRIRVIALKKGYTQLRISGNEPTLAWEHLLRVLELVEEDGLFTFILETNGIEIGADKSKARDLSKFTHVHVRVSLKGTSHEEFHKLTGAREEFYEYQLSALKNLADYGVPAHPAVMLSFSSEASYRSLLERLGEIDPRYVKDFEEEYVFLYPHVVENLRKAGLSPRVAYSPDEIPDELV